MPGNPLDVQLALAAVRFLIFSNPAYTVALPLIIECNFGIKRVVQV